MKSILDPSFRYTASYETDIAKTFARIKREAKAAEFARLAEASAQAVATLTAAMVPRDPQKVQEAADTARILMIQESRRIAAKP